IRPRRGTRETATLRGAALHDGGTGQLWQSVGGTRVRRAQRDLVGDGRAPGSTGGERGRRCRRDGSPTGPAHKGHHAQRFGHAPSRVGALIFGATTEGGRTTLVRDENMK